MRHYIAPHLRCCFRRIACRLRLRHFAPRRREILSPFISLRQPLRHYCRRRCHYATPPADAATLRHTPQCRQPHTDSHIVAIRYELLIIAIVTPPLRHALLQPQITPYRWRVFHYVDYALIGHAATLSSHNIDITTAFARRYAAADSFTIHYAFIISILMR